MCDDEVKSSRWYFSLSTLLVFVFTTSVMLALNLPAETPVSHIGWPVAFLRFGECDCSSEGIEIARNTRFYLDWALVDGFIVFAFVLGSVFLSESMSRRRAFWLGEFAKIPARGVGSGHRMRRRAQCAAWQGVRRILQKSNTSPLHDLF